MRFSHFLNIRFIRYIIYNTRFSFYYYYILKEYLSHIFLLLMDDLL